MAVLVCARVSLAGVDHRVQHVSDGGSSWTTGSLFCVAVCSPSCSNGGTCGSPGVCTCVSGWTGTRCATGKAVLRREICIRD